jgi:hypothetical protein
MLFSKPVAHLNQVMLLTIHPVPNGKRFAFQHSTNLKTQQVQTIKTTNNCKMKLHFPLKFAAMAAALVAPALAALNGLHGKNMAGKDDTGAPIQSEGGDSNRFHRILGRGPSDVPGIVHRKFTGLDINVSKTSDE